MKKNGGLFELSATDLVGYLNCRHLSDLDRAVAEGALLKPKVWDPLLQILWERGAVHEQNYVEHLTQTGFEVARIDGVHVTDKAVSETLAAMKDGAQVIAQGALAYQGWVGRADSRPAWFGVVVVVVVSARSQPIEWLPWYQLPARVRSGHEHPNDADCRH
jgi:uncharacterized protein